jgi:hypothetical protein
MMCSNLRSKQTKQYNSTDTDLAKRRDITKGQKAMAYAMRHPKTDDKGGRGKKSSDPSGFSRTRIKQARRVLHLSRQFEAPKIADAAFSCRREGLQEA